MATTLPLSEKVKVQKKSYLYLGGKRKFKNKGRNYISKSLHQTAIWLNEETHLLNCDTNILLVKNGDFITENFEIKPNQFSKTSGLVIIHQKNNLVQTVKIREGLIYEGKKVSTRIKNIKYPLNSKKLYFPGEKVFSKILILEPSLCEIIKEKNKNQILIQPIKLYEFSQFKNLDKTFKAENISKQKFKINTTKSLVYQTKQIIKTDQSLNLINQSLSLETNRSFLNDLSIQLIRDNKQKTVNFELINGINLNNYISPSLKYKNLDSSFLIQKSQFIDIYTTLGYLESKSINGYEIVKFKINQGESKQILLISNNHCIKVKKSSLPNNKLYDFIQKAQNTNYIGKIIIENPNFFTIQKGRPYFFPNCNVEKLETETSLQYKQLPIARSNNNNNNTNRELSLKYSNLFKIIIKTDPKEYSEKKFYWKQKSDQDKFSLKIELSKIFIKKNGKLYSSLIPRFLKQFNVESKKERTVNYLKYPKSTLSKLDRTLLLNNKQSSSLTFIKFMEYPLTKSTKSIGLYSITEDLFEQELNSVFCQNQQFLEDGVTIGFLNIEKEITGDIVQGLPRIEEILEARKKQQVMRKIPTSRKTGLLTQLTSLDKNFEFQKIGTPIKENEKINPHKLIKVYFNYYGFLKPFFCDKNYLVNYTRLINNFEGTYKSFKKVQSFILSSVQSVYRSQGVTINDKHIEVIIQQMTTKVLVTDEGDTPLLKREVIDLYHMSYINKIIQREKKQKAYYLPLLFGITRAALNNPSFISAASFQETTRVLTKAAIEGRIDWLRGLKENIIIGHLIPAGTGSRNFKMGFKSKSKSNKKYLV